MSVGAFRWLLGLLLGLTVVGLLGLLWGSRALGVWFDNLHWTTSFLACAVLAYQVRPE